MNFWPAPKRTLSAFLAWRSRMRGRSTWSGCGIAVSTPSAPLVNSFPFALTTSLTNTDALCTDPCRCSVISNHLNNKGTHSLGSCNSLAVSAGALIYVGGTHLLLAVEKETKKYSFVSLAAGILVVVLIVISKG
jgi:hypothetical protein